MTITDSEKFSVPQRDEYADYYHTYVGKFPADNFIERFAAQTGELRELVGNLPKGQDEVLHEPYTWTLKQVVGHLIDCERIFSNRMLHIGVGDENPIPGIDQDIYVANLDYKNITMAELLDEFEYLRKSNVLLAKRMSPESLARRGIASDNEVTAKANLYIIAGHFVYHFEIMQQRLQNA